MNAQCCAVIACLLVACLPALAQDDPNTLLREIERLGVPDLADGPAVLYSRANLQRGVSYVELVERLRRADAGHRRLPELMRQKWSVMTGVAIAFTDWDGPVGDELSHIIFDDPSSQASDEMTLALRDHAVRMENRVLVELDAILGADPAGPLAEQAYYPRARILAGRVLDGDRSCVARAIAAFDEMMERGAAADCEGFMPPRLLHWIAENGYEDEADPRRLALLRRLVREFPNSKQAGLVAGKLRQLEAIGAPFELAFDDVITGRQVTMEALRGKVVLLDFWATWCVPCIAAMPHVEELRKHYQGQGLVVIGVSTDDAADAPKVRAFIEKHDRPWLQFHAGADDPGFDRGWGISEIPHYFVIDRKGRLHASVKADSGLDEVLAALMASD